MVDQKWHLRYNTHIEMLTQEQIMYYAVLKCEYAVNDIIQQAGGVYNVSKINVGNKTLVRASNINNPAQVLTTSQDVARSIFTKPTSNLDSALEESFMICESVYC